MTNNDKHFEDLMDFPAEMTFRVVGDATALFRAASESAVFETLGRAASPVAVQPSKGGKYWVVRLTVTVDNADEIRALYQALNGVDGARMVM
ncbi:MAG: DUF493 domain-containing protein [Myxococcota bacterium]